MPQIDKVTFYGIIWFITVFYIGVYIILNTTHFYNFFATLKIRGKRILSVFYKNKIYTRNLRALLSIPLLQKL